MTLQWPPKDPRELLDYRIEWSPRLDSDVIVTSSWVAVPSDLTVVRDEFSKRTTTVWVSGGTDGTTYTLTNTITTVKGRTEISTVSLPVQQST